MGRVAGKVGLVAGAGGGIGGADTEALAREGAAVSATTATAGRPRLPLLGFASSPSVRKSRSTSRGDRLSLIATAGADQWPMSWFRNSTDQ
jgi:NAD(P)-dependent dehydrogenase (short-subunit alcohol dehydrogenase family)